MAETLRGVIERSHFFVYIILWLRHFGFTKKKKSITRFSNGGNKIFFKHPKWDLVSRWAKSQLCPFFPRNAQNRRFISRIVACFRYLIVNGGDYLVL